MGGGQWQVWSGFFLESVSNRSSFADDNSSVSLKLEIGLIGNPVFQLRVGIKITFFPLNGIRVGQSGITSERAQGFFIFITSWFSYSFLSEEDKNAGGAKYKKKRQLSFKILYIFNKFHFGQEFFFQKQKKKKRKRKSHSKPITNFLIWSQNSKKLEPRCYKVARIGHFISKSENKG